MSNLLLNFINQFSVSEGMEKKDKRRVYVRRFLFIITSIITAFYFSAAVGFSLLLAYNAILWAKWPNLNTFLEGHFGHSLTTLFAMIFFIALLCLNFIYVATFFLSNYSADWFDYLVLLPTHLYMVYSLASFIINKYIDD